MLRFLLLPLLLSGRTVRALQHQFHFCNHILASKHSPIGLSFSSKVIHSTRRRPHQRILLSRPHPPSALTRAHCLLWPFQPCASRLQGCKGCAGINLTANGRCYCASCLQVHFLLLLPCRSNLCTSARTSSSLSGSASERPGMPLSSLSSSISFASCHLPARRKPDESEGAARAPPD